MTASELQSIITQNIQEWGDHWGVEVADIVNETAPMPIWQQIRVLLNRLRKQEQRDDDSASTACYVACEDCSNCVIVEDRTEEGRRPWAYCILKIPMQEVECMEWMPRGGTCPQFSAGEATYD